MPLLPIRPCLALLTVLIAALAPASAKRSAPVQVPPVVIGSTAYSAPHDLMGWVVATDLRSQKELWRVRIYTVKIDPLLETDVQDVYIAALEQKDGTLLVTDERGGRYVLDLATRKVSKPD